MPPTLDRLTFVYDTVPGALADLLIEGRNVLRFGSENSGLIHLPAREGDPSPSVQEIRVPIRVMSREELNGPILETLGDNELPCLVGHSGAITEVLLNSGSLARCGASVPELRGKIRFALARIDWLLT